ncbi:MAG: helix-turn-helix domain-containing protein, partial [Methylococcales bacterium]
KRAVIMSDDNIIGFDDLELQQNLEEGIPLNLKIVREEAETIAIKRALAYSRNNISNAAKLLGVTRPTLYSLFEKYNIRIEE